MVLEVVQPNANQKYHEALSWQLRMVFTLFTRFTAAGFTNKSFFEKYPSVEGLLPPIVTTETIAEVTCWLDIIFWFYGNILSLEFGKSAAI